MKNDPIPPGKLPETLLRKNIKKFFPFPSNARVHIGPHIGQDNAIIDFGDKFLVIKSDPITFTTAELGYYVVSINANDVALSGAKPKWFTCTLLLPPKITDETLVNQIFDDIALECKKLGIAVIGGHTEITIDLNRPLAIGTMIGEVSKSNLITTFGGKPGDALLLTRGVAIEGCAIISVEKEQFLLEKGISQEIINLGKSRLHNPGICIVRDAALLTENFAIHAMHDPTEGGLAMGVVELAQNSNCGAILEEKRIPLIEPTQLLCNLLDINPFNLIASGCILFAVDPLIAQNIIKFMAKYDVLVSNIGILTGEKGNFQLKHKNNTLDPLNYSPTDELLKIL